MKDEIDLFVEKWRHDFCVFKRQSLFKTYKNAYPENIVQKLISLDIIRNRIIYEMNDKMIEVLKLRMDDEITEKKIHDLGGKYLTEHKNLAGKLVEHLDLMGEIFKLHQANQITLETIAKKYEEFIV